MPGIPTTFYRKTNHKKPRYQLYYPGFNPANSCWLDGDWVTVTQAEYDAIKDEHQQMFQAATEGHGRQHYRDAGTPLDKLSEAQRTAYEHYSGQATLYCEYENGDVGPVGIEMAGNEPRPDQVKWMRDCGMKIIRFTKNGHTGKVEDALEGFDFPDDLVSENTEPRDPWASIVEENKQREQEMYGTFLKGATEGIPGMPMADAAARGFMAQMAFTGLTQKEESIIRTEWNQQRGTVDPYADLDRDVREYVEMRKGLQEAFPEDFDTLYEERRATHNHCARRNLGDTGVLFCFVLPRFYADGTHEPWGPRDVPWGAT